MTQIKKYLLESFFTVGQLPNHALIKDDILRQISESESDSLQISDDYYSDSISRLDWNSARSFTGRPWVETFKPHIDSYLNLVADGVGYQSAIIEELWYQQYYNGDKHGWHIHGSNFTGVYYLELPESSPKTQILDPLSQGQVITPNIKEGDVLLFPSYTIHRAPIITNTERKTIISFNFVMDLVSLNVLNKINLL